ncbi:hypothetical protein B0O99DRAFT_211243 [Bisporella sp. PMI_857]|nr:hypothetical protein B0O99DRAFT_211243 [Bisporella sp. PMI_857]
MDFAPYQDVSPETHRALSPPPNRSSLEQSREGRRSFSPNIQSPPLSPTKAPSNNPWAPVRSSLDAVVPSFVGRAFGSDGAGLEGGRGHINEFETSLPIRLDYEACLAYLLLPPAGGVLLLLAEQKSDYVRFHAWQSSLLFTAIFVLHLIFSWSAFISWTFLICDIALISYLTLRAYKDADTLDRCEVPFFGKLASSILDDE